jgi:DNA replication and repair protein RecF
MRVGELALSGFRNLVPLKLSPAPRFNVFHGDNGAGKSSLLEALAYLSSLGSFRAAKKEDIVQHGAFEARMAARIEGSGYPSVVKVTLPRESARKVEVDGKRPQTLGRYFTAFPSVLFHPGDVELMAGGPEPRRAFLDRVLSQMHAGYARTVAEYETALRSRNRLLKQEHVDRRSVAAYDGILVDHGVAIGAARAELTRLLKPRVESYFAEITERALPIVMEYAARHEPTPEALRYALEAGYERDLARGFTGVGPHGDDLRIEVRQTHVKNLASQGQHRAIVLSLKVAEMRVLTECTSRVPWLLLDDVSSELDRTKNRHFFELLARMGGQVFLTTTHPEFILLKDERTDFSIEAGQVRLVSP